MTAKTKTVAPPACDNGQFRRPSDGVLVRAHAQQLLQEQSRVLEAFFKHTITPLVFLDRDFNFIRVNEAYAAACNRGVSDFPGHNHFEFYPHAENETIFREVVRTKVLHRAVAKPFVFPDHPEWGTTYWDWTLVPILDAAGEVELLVFSLADVTERKETEHRDQFTKRLLELFTRKGSRKEYLDALVQMVGQWCGCRCVGVRLADSRGQIPYESSIGFSPEFLEAEGPLLVGKDACFCTRVLSHSPDSHEAALMTPAGSFRCDNTARFLAGLPAEKRSRYRGLCVRNGFMSLAIIPIRHQGQTLGTIHVADEREGAISPACVEFLESISPLVYEAIHRFGIEEQMRRMNAALEERAVQLQVLAGALTQAEHRERRRLAQTLHDNLQQILYAVRLGLSRVKNRVADEDFQADVGQLDEWVNQSIAVSRSLTAELSPPVLYDAGFSVALEWLARHVEDTYGLEVEVEAAGSVDVSSEALRVLLFEAVRELLFNVAKHAHARRARVRTEWADGRLCVVVSDRGAGFDPARLRIARHDSGGMGLFAVRERLEIFGGSMTIESAPGRGTDVVISVPCRPPRPATPGGVMLDRTSADSAEAQPDSHAPPVSDRRIRVLLADDHKVLREGLSSLLREQPDLDVVGEAENGRRAVELALQTHPDVVVMDMVMPQMDGIEATRRIMAAMPDTRVIGLSMYDDDNLASAMCQAGAVTYLSKGGSSGPLIDAIRSSVSSQESSDECDPSNDREEPDEPERN